MSLIKVKKVGPNNLGEILGKFCKLEADNVVCHADISMWGAPSECHQDQNTGFERDWEKLEKEVGQYGKWLTIADKRCGGSRGSATIAMERCVSHLIKNSEHPAFDRRNK